MKNILTTFLILFALGLNAQDTYSEQLCDGSSLHIQFKDDYNVHIKCDVLDLTEVDFFTSPIIINVISLVSNTAVLRIDTNQYKYRYLVCNEIQKVVENYLCLTKKDTIYDYGTRTPKEIDSLENAGHVVMRYPTTNSVLRLFTETYDTVEVEGLAIYLSNEDFTNGVDFKLLPTIKTVVKCRNCFTSTSYGVLNSFKLSFNDKILKSKQLYQIPNSNLWVEQDDSYVYEWQDVDLTKYKEFIFIEKPK